MPAPMIDSGSEKVERTRLSRRAVRVFRLADRGEDFDFGSALVELHAGPNCRALAAQERIGRQLFGKQGADRGLAALAAARAFARRSFTAALSGSTEAAKYRLPTVYSCPQKTRTPGPSGTSTSFSEWCIMAGVPSNRRPHPAKNRVSPVKTASPTT